MNIEGLSEATLEKFISRGYIQDIYRYLPSGSDTKKKFKTMEGFGEKSYEKLIRKYGKGKNDDPAESHL